jgi:CRP/FNR family transcriptional regulator, cyclic AMP receptor protein
MTQARQSESAALAAVRNGRLLSGKTRHTGEVCAPDLRMHSGLPVDLWTKPFASAKLIRLAAGEILFRAGASGDGCYRVEHGLIKVAIVSGSGGERILAFLGQGAIVGELSIIDGLPRSATVMAVRETMLGFLSPAAFDVFADKHPEVYKSLAKLLARRLRETDRTIAAISFLSLKGRLARTILELADHFGQEVGLGRIVIRQKIGQNDLAAMAGIARENVTRVLNDWQRHKILSRLSGYYCIENKAQLEHQLKL